MSWAAVAKSATAPAAPTEAPAPSADERIAVVDTNALISGLRLEQLADRFCTIPEVLAEVRDKQARAFLSTLPFTLDVRDPSDDSVKAVQRFARETGDIHSLSAVDLKLLALAHTLEVAAHGGANLREHPVQVRTRQKHKSRPRPLPGWGNVANPEDWRVVDEAPEEQLTNAIGGQSRINAAVQSLTQGAEEVADGAAAAAAAAATAAATTAATSTSAAADVLPALPLPTPSAGGAATSLQPQQPEPGSSAGGLGGGVAPAADAAAAAAQEAGVEAMEEDSEDSEEEEEDDGWETAHKSRNAARRQQRKARRHQAWLERQQQQQQGEPASAAPSTSGRQDGQPQEADGVASAAVVAPAAAEGDVSGSGQGAATQEEGMFEEKGDGGCRGEEGEMEEEEEDQDEGEEGEGDEEEGEGMELVTDEGYDDDEDEQGAGHDGASEAGTAVTSVTDATATESLVATTATATTALGTDMEVELLPNTTSNVFTVTADFAMQNVMLQMGLRLVTRDGMQVTRVSRWALRCSACYFVTKEAGRLFCPRCGNMTMEKVEVTVGPGGAEFFGVRKKFILRGTKFSLPKPKGGRGARTNPVLREDVLMARMAMRQRGGNKPAAAGEIDPFAPEYGSETWHQVAGRGQGGRGGGRGRGMPVMVTSWKHNPNEVKPQRKSRRK